MTRERLNELWPVMEHVKNGGRYQWRFKEQQDQWRDGSEDCMNRFVDGISGSVEIRIKPAPKLIPLDAEDWLKGGPWWVRKNSTTLMIPVGPVSETGYVRIIEDASCLVHSPGEMMVKYQRRSGSDPEGWWTPCSKESKE